MDRISSYSCVVRVSLLEFNYTGEFSTARCAEFVHECVNSGRESATKWGGWWCNLPRVWHFCVE